MLRSLVATLVALAVWPAAACAASWQWPVRGPVLERFRYGPDPFVRGQHRGVDIAAPRGTAVRAACGGTVGFAGTAGTSGGTVSVACGNLTATYLHLTGIAVRRGERLRSGVRIGAVGTTGRRRHRRAHLHLGARRTGRRWAYVDPLRLLGDPAAPAPLLPGGRRPAVPALPRLGPAPAPVLQPGPALARPAPAPVPQPRATPGLPLGGWWVPAGLGLAGASLGAAVARAALGSRRRGRRGTAAAARAREKTVQRMA